MLYYTQLYKFFDYFIVSDKSQLNYYINKTMNVTKSSISRCNNCC